MKDAGRVIGDRENPLFMHSQGVIMNERRHAGKRQADYLLHDEEIIMMSIASVRYLNNMCRQQQAPHIRINEGFAQQPSKTPRSHSLVPPRSD